MKTLSAALGAMFEKIITQQKELKATLQQQQKEIAKLTEAHNKAKEPTKNVMSRILEEILTNRKEQSKRSSIVFDLSERVLPEKPFNSCDDFTSFEKKLRNSEAYQYAVSFFSFILSKKYFYSLFPLHR